MHGRKQLRVAKENVQMILQTSPQFKAIQLLRNVTLTYTPIKCKAICSAEHDNNQEESRLIWQQGTNCWINLSISFKLTAGEQKNHF